MKVAIVNYGMGNLASVRRAFEDVGAEPFIANHAGAIYDASSIVLPGVGAFGEGMKRLHEGGWVEALHDAVLERKMPLLGICLGMQMLASTGYEGGRTAGLGFIPGEVRRLDELGCALRIPHVGWNEVRYDRTDVLFSGIPDALDFYFVHSYAFVPEKMEDRIATTFYGCELTAAVRHENVCGCQFHPEKSSKAGRLLLKNFLEYSAC